MTAIRADPDRPTAISVSSRYAGVAVKPAQRNLRTEAAPFIRLIALLLLVLQLGVIAHRIEHYLIPEHMECGEDACVSFAPITDPPALPPVVVRPPNIAYFVQFWTVHDTTEDQLSERLGFRAHAPPV
jgi:hypothetical protein